MGRDLIRKIQIFLNLLGFTFLVICYQNCGPTSPQTFEELDLASLAAQTDFPYDIHLDHIAYSSCSEVSFNEPSNTFFSFKAGAYGFPSSPAIDGGIKLRESYIETTRGIDALKQLELLQSSPLSIGAQPQLAIRNNNFQSIKFVSDTSEGEPSLGKDYSNIFTSLSTDYISSVLLKNERTKPLRYLSGNNGKGLRIEGQITINKSEAAVENIRDELTQSNSKLTVTFNSSSDPETPIARAPAHFKEGVKSDSESVYGSGYLMQFARPLDGINGTPTRVLSGVQEVDLEGRSNSGTNGTWDCPEDLQFKIIPPSDARFSEDEFLNASSQNNYTQKADDISNFPDKFRTIRNVLPLSQWYVSYDPNDFRNNYVIPKVAGLGSCYPYVNFTEEGDPLPEPYYHVIEQDDNGQDFIAKHGSQIDYETYNGGANRICTPGQAYENASDGKQYSCFHYISICHRVSQ